MTSRSCALCGASLARRRSDARYCSGACRAAASRARAESRNPAREAHRRARVGREDPSHLSVFLDEAAPPLGGGFRGRAKRHGVLRVALGHRLVRALKRRGRAATRPPRYPSVEGGEAEG